MWLRLQLQVRKMVIVETVENYMSLPNLVAPK